MLAKYDNNQSVEAFLVFRWIFVFDMANSNNLTYSAYKQIIFEQCEMKLFTFWYTNTDQRLSVSYFKKLELLEILNLNSHAIFFHF